MIRSTQKNIFSAGGSFIAFVGRRPAVADEVTRKRMVDIGVARDNGDGTISYIGVQRIHLKNGQKVDVPENGLVDIKPSDIANTDFSYEVVDA